MGLAEATRSPGGPVGELLALDGASFSEFAVQLVPEKLARRHLVVPLRAESRSLTCVTCTPISLEAESDLAFASGRRINFVLTTRAAVLEALERCYPKPGDLELLAARLRAGMSAAANPNQTSGTAASQAIKMCGDIIGRAIEIGASDLSLEYGPRGGTIRYHVGAEFKAMPALPVEVSQPLGDRFKIMARVAVAVRQRPQNGSFRVVVKGEPADVHLSTTPTRDGEQIVMEIADYRPVAVAVAEPRPAGPVKTRRILVTDDEPITRRIVTLLLKREGFDVLEAANGEEAIQITEREHPDLWLMDLNMPVMDGYQAIHFLRHHARLQTPVIVLTAEEGESVERRVLELGANDYIVKPSDPAILLARVNAVFNRLNILAG